MSSLEIFGDDEYFTSIQADGVCVATPTGSTAYNLAAGGSLCHPENPVILLTAICAHTLNFRPIILPDTIVLRIGVPYDARTSSWASFDGRERVELLPGDYVTVSASRFPFANVMTPGQRSHEWINSISRTLNWNSRERQRASGHNKYCLCSFGKDFNPHEEECSQHQEFSVSAVGINLFIRGYMHLYLISIASKGSEIQCLINKAM
ncbi:NAD kinase /ATP NAD kinase [Coccidioides immitis RMSCC 2394]|uniref:NAD kinase /ATP NAD kinase n=1 Tax=Coccidioides immitis RMSCC 2394 TaxID=404692 RepID=A0A0J6YJQ9_COCIT|nr:NAD kinase /ATP NAD kinase [Coccidioides immitis RMSCC 2394]